MLPCRMFPTCTNILKQASSAVTWYLQQPVDHVDENAFDNRAHKQGSECAWLISNKPSTLTQICAYCLSQAFNSVTSIPSGTGVKVYVISYLFTAFASPTLLLSSTKQACVSPCVACRGDGQAGKQAFQSPHLLSAGLTTNKSSTWHPAQPASCAKICQSH